MIPQNSYIIYKQLSGNNTTENTIHSVQLEPLEPLNTDDYQEKKQKRRHAWVLSPHKHLL